MQHISLLNAAHDSISTILRPGDSAVDATVGNGYDTLFLLQQIQPAGRVYGFDCQQLALDRTLAKIPQTAYSDCLTLFHASHAFMENMIPHAQHGRLKAVMFNLGYLPGSDKTVITQAGSTLAALNAACKLLAPGGLVTVVAYPGHPGGDQETEEVKHWCSRLNDDQFTVSILYSSEHKESAPRLFVIKKSK